MNQPRAEFSHNIESIKNGSLSLQKLAQLFGIKLNMESLCRFQTTNFVIFDG